MRILVTGANGFIGQRFCVSELPGVEVVALVRSSVLAPCKNFKVYDGTIESIISALDGVDVVLHLATLYVAEHQSSDISGLIDANITFGTLLLDAMRHASVKKIVNVGTVWQRYDAKDHSYANLYAATKQAYQEIVTWYCDAYDLSAINLHLGDTYGEGDKRRKLVQLLIEVQRNGSCLDMSGGEQKIDLCHVSDVIAGLRIACEMVLTITPGQIETYSLLSNNAISIRDLVALVEDVLDVKLQINWGARPYRKREIMCPPYSAYDTLPGWTPEVDISQGILLLCGRKSNAEEFRC